jgi:hypothetical protein
MSESLAQVQFFISGGARIPGSGKMADLTTVNCHRRPMAILAALLGKERGPCAV